MRIEAIHHVQLAMPSWGEDDATEFYESILGIPRVPKPDHLAARGGCWFERGSVRLHLGVEDPFHPARKAHVALRVSDLDDLRRRLDGAGVAVTEDQPLPGYERFYANDPFGNRLEFLQPVAERTTAESASTRPVVIVGMGEMGGVFARAFLSVGHPVQPVLRSSAPDDVAAFLPEPATCLVAVAEADLDQTLHDLPPSWRDRVVLLQNELVPSAWRRHRIDDPTVAVVWFEKKAGRPVTVILPTPVAGPGAELVVAALGALDIPATVIASGPELEFALVAKNLYILTANIAGLVAGGTVGELWHDHRDLTEAVAAEILDIQQTLVDSALDRPALVAEMVKGFDADPDHGATGRSAPARLRRALAAADDAGLAVPRLRGIAAEHAS